MNLDNFAPHIGGRNTPRQVGYVGSVTVFAFFNHDEVFHELDFIPVYLRMLFSVPGGILISGLSETVTAPRFEGCLN